MNTFEDRLIALFDAVHHLDRVPRAGYVVRGVAHPESVAAHSHFVSLLVLMFVEEYPGRFDREKALTMALIHDLSEAKLMDIPMPYADAYLKKAKDRAEQEIFEDMFAGFASKFAAAHQEFLDAKTPEARLVRGLDKAQMMIKVLFYERERSGYLEEFWTGAANFRDYGVPEVSALFDAVCARAGRVRPKPLQGAEEGDA
jgi:putative hydrolase of HD superfamily